MWIETSLEVYAVIKAKHSKEMSVHSSFTDIEGDGYHFSSGRPTIETEWGFKSADTPLLRIEQTKQSKEQKEWDTKVFIHYTKE